MPFAVLPADVLFEFLLYLPDFHVLNSLISASRSFYTVFQTRRIRILKSVAENLLGVELREEFVGLSVNPDPENADANVFETIKFLTGARNVVEALEPAIFRLLIHPDAHWDEPDRCPTVMEAGRLRRAAYRFVRFCALPSGLQQSRFLACLKTIEVFELVHLVDGLRKMVQAFDADDGQEDDRDDARVSRIVSTGLADIWRLWNLRPSVRGRRAPAEFHEMMAAAGAGEDVGAFDDAFHHFEVSRNLSAFDATRTRALLDVGHQQTEEALMQLECLLEPPSCVTQTQYTLQDSFSPLLHIADLMTSSPAPRPKSKRPRFRSLKLPRCDGSNHKTTQLPFLPDDLNSLPIRSDIPYFMLVLNGEPRIMPLNPRQLAELVNNMYL